MGDIGKYSSGELGAEASNAPALLPLARLLPPQLASPAGIASGIASFLLAFGLSIFVSHHLATQEKRAPLERIILRAVDYPGVIIPTDSALALASDHVFRVLGMSEPEKGRLKYVLSGSPVRIGGVTLWDNVHEDGDAIIVRGAGFEQRLEIANKPSIYFVPYLPGGSIQILGARDGGGGITLGVKTSLGEQFLPALAPGQVIEIQIP